MTYPPPPPPRRGNRPLIVIVAVLAVVVLTGGVAAVLLANDGRLPWTDPTPACGYLNTVSGTDCTPPPESSHPAASYEVGDCLRMPSSTKKAIKRIDCDDATARDLEVTKIVTDAKECPDPDGQSLSGSGDKYVYCVKPYKP
ncbi:MAG TPA: hypothetical protein VE172_03830 [Stackebrandtia sp.]|jgi:hypothetical protein|uniref:LppU/SCO3897 family protein n=1 Tax=Stackebrandtia sp. TaxID=2023065 RepID=UPI002D38CE3F|nr:hypothetical protein [Stackebrandtia sp.]HZE37919.1 hypothetical protein [Stackebrandtia sp.]